MLEFEHVVTQSCLNNTQKSCLDTRKSKFFEIKSPEFVGTPSFLVGPAGFEPAPP